MPRSAITYYDILLYDSVTTDFHLVNESMCIEAASKWINEWMELEENEENPFDPILWPCGVYYPEEWKVVRIADSMSTNSELLPGAFVDSADAKAKLLNLLASLTQYVEHEETTICDASYLGHIARTFEDLAGEIESTNLGGDEGLPLRLFTRGMIWEIEPDPLLLDLVEKNKADVRTPKSVNDFEQLPSVLEQLGHDAFVSTVKMHLEEHSRQESSVKVILGESS